MVKGRLKFLKVLSIEAIEDLDRDWVVELKTKKGSLIFGCFAEKTDADVLARTLEVQLVSLGYYKGAFKGGLLR